MPPGIVRTKAPSKVIEKVTAEACISIARKVQHTREMAGDEPGSDAAQQVAEFIQKELLGGSVGPPESMTRVC